MHTQVAVNHIIAQTVVYNICTCVNIPFFRCTSISFKKELKRKIEVHGDVCMYTVYMIRWIIYACGVFVCVTPQAPVQIMSFYNSNLCV